MFIENFKPSAAAAADDVAEADRVIG